MPLKLGMGILAVILSLLTAATVIVYQSGMLVVSVQEKYAPGYRLYLPLPIALVNLALNFMPDRQLQEIRAQLGSWKNLLMAACDELAHCPSGSLVEVENAQERVYITKQGDDLIVDVDSRSQKVHVKVPIKALGTVLAKIADANTN